MPSSSSAGCSRAAVHAALVAPNVCLDGVPALLPATPNEPPPPPLRRALPSPKEPTLLPHAAMPPSPPRPAAPLLPPPPREAWPKLDAMLLTRAPAARGLAASPLPSKNAPLARPLGANAAASPEATLLRLALGGVSSALLPRLLRAADPERAYGPPSSLATMPLPWPCGERWPGDDATSSPAPSRLCGEEKASGEEALELDAVRVRGGVVAEPRGGAPASAAEAVSTSEPWWAWGGALKALLPSSGSRAGGRAGRGDGERGGDASV